MTAARKRRRARMPATPPDPRDTRAVDAIMARLRRAERDRAQLENALESATQFVGSCSAGVPWERGMSDECRRVQARALELRDYLESVLRCVRGEPQRDGDEDA